ncbi:hypothetical protein DFH08DRAFT_1029232 [Mycena albidolilacea]|uniref:Uncharacterized protein n=1 Tax=Mycena albidolilacea TaxID=1033008 RepID=A0AAD6ZJ52_9AGAR|nr:hypothetical protein DFH08DRAFT_1029232 [Mycena albidolilacea]
MVGLQTISKEDKAALHEEPKHILKAVPWDMAPASNVVEVCDIIVRWRLTLDIMRTPQSACRVRKQLRPQPLPITPQPVFTPQPAALPNPATPRSFGNRRRGGSHGGLGGTLRENITSQQLSSTATTPHPLPFVIPSQLLLTTTILAVLLLPGVAHLLHFDSESLHSGHSSAQFANSASLRTHESFVIERQVRKLRERTAVCRIGCPHLVKPNEVLEKNLGE